MTLAFDAYVTAALFARSGRAAFALGDGRVWFEGAGEVVAHPDSGALCAAVHPSGEGIVTGGDDGRLVWSRPAGPEVLAEAKGRWIDHIAVSPVSGLIAYACGREVGVVSASDPKFARSFTHDKTISGLGFDPKGLKIAAATYGGVVLWFAKVSGQKPQLLKCAGSHTGVLWSPDGKFLVTAMQDSQLHAWRLPDGKDMNFGGYPGKIKSMTFLSGGLLMATSGANGSVVWPFSGGNGPMGRQAAEVGYDQETLVAQVAAAPALSLLAGGREDGRVFLLELRSNRSFDIRPDKGAPITALALTDDGRRLAWGDEDGAAGVVDLSPDGEPVS